MDVNKIIYELREIADVKIFKDKKEFRENSYKYCISLLDDNNYITKISIYRCTIKEIKKILHKITELETLISLDISRNGLTEIPYAISSLRLLQTLDLSGNELIEVDESISDLKSLRILDLSCNQLTGLPKTMSNLKALQVLDLNYNNLTDIPLVIGELECLKVLRLKSNKLNKIPQAILELESLQILDLKLNEITYIPQSIGKLSSLKTLILSNNKLKQISESIGKLINLEELMVDNNPLIDPPKQIIRLGNKAILEYIKAKYKESVKVYEAKLMIVGEPGAGKTTLRRKLIDPNSPLPNIEETTEGIDIDVWKYKYKDSKYTVNLWDFGGQQIYRSTHQFFMSERVLYVLLADSREEKTDYFDWLHRIELFANDSPVVIAHNEMKDRKKEIDISKISGLFPRVTEPLRCNLAKINGTDRKQDFYNLVDELQYKISKLEVIGQEFPKSWIELRNDLQSVAKKQNYISSEEYFRICIEKHGIEHEGALVLGNYLHAIGAILFFSDDVVLKHIVILKPEWGTDAVYKVIDDSNVQNANGRFTRNDVSRIWADNKYKNKYTELLKLMKRFRICYETIYEKDVYILPQLLKYPPKDYKWEDKTDLHFEYQYYGYYLKSIMYHFIVAMHQYIEDESKVYRNCVVLKQGDVKAEVKADESKESIHIKVNGSLCNDFLANIRYEFEKIHSEYPKLQVESMVPCNCKACRDSEEPALFKYSELCDRLKHGKKTIDCSKNKYCEVEIALLIREFPKIVVSERDGIYEKEIGNMSIDAKGDVNIIYGDGQVAKGKDINQEMIKDSQKLIDVVTDLKQAISKEDLEKEVKEQIKAVIERIEDNDYDLKPKVKTKLRDKLRNVLQDVANVATVGGVITQLIVLLA